MKKQYSKLICKMITMCEIYSFIFYVLVSTPKKTESYVIKNDYLGIDYR